MNQRSFLWFEYVTPTVSYYLYKTFLTPLNPQSQFVINIITETSSKWKTISIDQLKPWFTQHLSIKSYYDVFPDI